MGKRIVVYNDGRKKATMKYLKKLRQIIFRVKPEVFARWEEAAKAMEYQSMRQFYIDAIEEKIERGNKTEGS